MGIKQLYNDNLRKLPNEYGDVSVMTFRLRQILQNFSLGTKCNRFTPAHVFIHIVYSYRTRQIRASYAMKLGAYLFPANQISIFKTRN